MPDIITGTFLFHIMKLFNKNKGSGNILVTFEGKRHSIAAGGFTEVPDEIGVQLLAKYPKILTTDSEVQALKAQRAEAAAQGTSLKSELETLRAENKTLKEQNEKLKLIAVEAPCECRVPELEKQLAELTAKLKTYEETPEKQTGSGKKSKTVTDSEK